MAKDTRTLKLSILADVDDLKKKLGEADKAVENNSNKIANFGKKAAAAFAVAAAAALAYAGKLAIDGVKSAIEDEQAQLKLASALRKATGATDAQIKATEDMILKTSLATGVADDKLRPALQRLAVSTKDTVEAQKLLSLALDISKGSGQSLETVANALGKAQDGNTTALGRLGLGISKADLATLSFTEVQQKLADLYGGAAAANAETFQGKIDQLKVAFNETKESIGAFLLPVLEKLLGYVTDFVIPIFEKVRDALSGKNGFGGSLSEIIGIIKSQAIPVLDTMNVAFQGIQKTVKENRDGLEDFIEIAKLLAPIFGKTLVEGIKISTIQISILITILSELAGIIKTILGSVINQINLIIRGINLIKPGADIPYLPNMSATSSSGSDYRSGERGLPTISNASPQTQATVINNISVQAIDSEGAARAVAKAINDSAARSVPLLSGGSSFIVAQ